MPSQPTEIAYSDTNWAACPNCNCESIQAGTLDGESNIVWQDVTCVKCGTTWTEEYKAIQRTNIDREEIL